MQFIFGSDFIKPIFKGINLTEMSSINWGRRDTRGKNIGI